MRITNRRVRALATALAAVSVSLVLTGQVAQLAEEQSPPTSIQRPGRGAYERFAVASDHPLASQAGLEILRAGGNAADAAAATMLALGVMNPQSSGMGGGGFALYYDAASGSLTFLDFRERAPAASTADMFANNRVEGGGVLSDRSQLGGLATGVPGEPAGIAELVERFGRKTLREDVVPAARLADGFPVRGALASMSGSFAAQLKADPEMRRWFERGADSIREGQILRQPTLARTMRQFGALGAPAIYRGRIAQTIVRENRARGGIMTMADLADYRVVLREPLEARALGYRWVTAPPPSAGGYTMLASLALLDRFIPVSALLDEDRVARRAAVFRRSVATEADLYATPLPDTVAGPRSPPEEHGTSHLCVVDADGNVASITTTVNLPFGARYTAAGMVMNDEMDDFASAVGQANAFGLPGGVPNLPGPGRRPVSTMSPTIVLDEHGAVLCVGGSGGSRIVTATEQVAWHTLVRGADPYDALEHPRIHHQGYPNTLRTEETNPQPARVLRGLRARGHALETASHSAVVQLIRIRRGESPRLIAVSDARKGGEPAGE